MTPLLSMTISVSLADPPESSALLAATEWLVRILLGTVATTVAIIAVAGVGFMALSGRVSVRRALTVICGCFILFGASSIAAGIQAAVQAGASAQPDVAYKAKDESPLTNLPGRPPGYDPYAGAAVPVR
jgi:type IV secretion system protein VirB2